MSQENTKVELDSNLVYELLTFGAKELQYQRRARFFGFFLKILFFIVALSIFYVMGEKQLAADGQQEMDPHVAVVNIYGAIAANGPSDADKIIPAFRRAMENPLCKALVLRINSPGGSPVQADRIYSEIMSLRAKHPKKKVYAVIEDIGASAAYYIASAADEILVNKSSLVGSIGVISAGFGFTDLMTKLGVERRVLTAGENKAMMDPYSPVREDLNSYWKSILNETHTTFIDSVKQGRGERLKLETEGLFSGLIWSGKTSIQIGLADREGSASDISREILKDKDNLVDYTPMPNFMKRLGLTAASALNDVIQAQSSISLQ